MDYKVNVASYTSRVVTGQYAHDESTISVTPNEDANLDNVLFTVRSKVKAWLKGEISTVGGKSPVVATTVQEQIKIVESVLAETPAAETMQATAVKKTRGPKKTTEAPIETPAEQAELEFSAPAEASIDDVREALQGLFKTKGQAIAQAVVDKFNAKKISDIKKEDYSAVLAEVKVALGKK